MQARFKGIRCINTITLARGDEKYMKFSDSLFLDENTIGMQQSIEKLTEKNPSSQSGKIIKVKKDFMHAVVDIPEFEQTVSELSSYTMEYGTELDKGKIVSLQRKIDEGSLDYDDVADLSTIVQKNYKHFFKTAPPSFVFNPTTAVGLALTVLAIVIRYTSDNNDNLAALIFLASINLIAIIYTLCLWPNNVVNALNLWMVNNAVPGVISKKLISPITRKMWKIVGNILIGCIIFLLIVSFAKNSALGNDILAILSLAISVLSDKIVELFTNIFAWRIYHDKKR